jgi:hypothetical protein
MGAKSHPLLRLFASHRRQIAAPPASNPHILRVDGASPPPAGNDGGRAQSPGGQIGHGGRSTERGGSCTACSAGEKMETEKAKSDAARIRGS